MSTPLLHCEHALHCAFIEAYATDPRKLVANYKFSDHSGRALQELNTLRGSCLSDDVPTAAEIPRIESSPPKDGRR